MKTQREILAARARCELTDEQTDRLLNTWDEERVELEVAELLAAGAEPSGHFPALLWDRYWSVRIQRVLPRLPRWKYYCEEPQPGAPLPRGAASVRRVKAELRALGIPECRVEFDRRRGVFLVAPPPLPTREFGFSVRQLPADA